MQVKASRRSRKSALDKVDGLVQATNKATGAVTWFIRVKDGRSETGKLLYKKFGPVASADRIPEIEAKAKAYARARAEEQKPRTLGKLHKRTLGEWLEIWLEDVVRVGQSATTYDNYKRSVRRQLLDNSIAQVALVDLDLERIGKWRSELEAKGVGRATINYALARLKGALEVAIEPSRLANNGIRINMARKLVPLKVKAKKPYVGSPSETRLVMQAIGPTYMQAMVQVATDLGLRRSETVALEWGDFDLDAGTVTIKRHVVVSGDPDDRSMRIVDGTKTSKGKWHTLNLSEPSIAALRQSRLRLMEHKLSGKTKEFVGGPSGRHAGGTIRAQYVDTANHRSGTPYVVPTTAAGMVGPEALVFPYWDGYHWDPSTLGNWFVRKCESVGIKGKSIHDLRHDCATFLIGAGVPLTVVADHMRHADASLTARVYSHLLASQERLAANTFNRIWADADGDVAQAV